MFGGGKIEGLEWGRIAGGQIGGLKGVGERKFMVQTEASEASEESKEPVPQNSTSCGTLF